MRGKTFPLAMALGLTLAGPAAMTLGAAPAAAQDWREHGGYGGYGDWHHDHDGIGAGGVILGLAAVAGVAAIASSAAHHDSYYDRGYYAAPSQGYYGYAPGYDQGGYSQTAVNSCAGAAVGQARGFAGYARFGRVDGVERRGDDVYVRGTVAVSGGDDRDDDELVSTRFTCKFDDGRVRSLRVDRPAYGYGYGY